MLKLRRLYPFLLLVSLVFILFSRRNQTQWEDNFAEKEQTSNVDRLPSQNEVSSTETTPISLHVNQTEPPIVNQVETEQDGEDEEDEAMPTPAPKPANPAKSAKPPKITDKWTCLPVKCSFKKGRCFDLNVNSPTRIGFYWRRELYTLFEQTEKDLRLDSWNPWGIGKRDAVPLATWVTQGGNLQFIAHPACPYPCTKYSGKNPPSTDVHIRAGALHFNRTILWQTSTEGIVDRPIHGDFVIDFRTENHEIMDLQTWRIRDCAACDLDDGRLDGCYLQNVGTSKCAINYTPGMGVGFVIRTTECKSDLERIMVYIDN